MVDATRQQTQMNQLKEEKDEGEIGNYKPGRKQV
jgi:hypothetical protein